MGVRKLDELVAFRLARELKLEVYRITKGSHDATADLKFRTQLFEAASGTEACIGEGFHRFVAGEFRQFLRYALASVGETRIRVTDGIHRGYFTEAECETALTLANRRAAATMNLYKSLGRFTAAHAKTNGADSKPSRRRQRTPEP